MYKKNLINLIQLIWITLVRTNFWTYRVYGKKIANINNYGAIKLAETNPFAIVLQGPLVIDSNFTIETIKLYRQNFPSAILILSTWTITHDIVSQLEKYGVNIIQNSKPDNPGISNVNLQIVTTRTGILEAKNLGALYVLKTRTDQRCYHPSLETYLFNLTHAFPLFKVSPIVKNRLVGLSLGTFKYRMYGVSDMFLYGHIDDMVRYWNIPCDLRSETPEERKKAGLTWRQFSMWRVCEVYFCTEYLKKIGHNIAFTLRDSFEVFRNYFVIIDQAAIQVYWHKYTSNEERYRDFNIADPQLSFNDWLTLYHSLDIISMNEDILDLNIINKVMH